MNVNDPERTQWSEGTERQMNGYGSWLPWETFNNVRREVKEADGVFYSVLYGPTGRIIGCFSELLCTARLRR